MNVCLYGTRLSDTKLDTGYIDGQKVPHVWEKNLCNVLRKETCFMTITTNA